MRISSRYTLLLGLPLAWLATGCATAPQTASTPPHSIQSQHAVSDARLRILAQEFERRGQYDEAAGLYQRSLQLNPNQPDVQRKLQMLASRNRLHRKTAPGAAPTATPTEAAVPETMVASHDATTASPASAPAAPVEPSTAPQGVTPAGATDAEPPVITSASQTVSETIDAPETSGQGFVPSRATLETPARPFPGEALDLTAAATPAPAEPGTPAAPIAEPTAQPTAPVHPILAAEADASAEPATAPSEDLPRIIAGPSAHRRSNTEFKIILPEPAEAETPAIKPATPESVAIKPMSAFPELAAAEPSATAPADAPARIVLEDTVAPTVAPTAAPAAQAVSDTPVAEAPVAETPGVQEPAAAPTEVVDTATTESVWKPTSLTRLCKDAHAAVLHQVARLDSEDAAVRKDALSQLARMGESARTASLAVRTLMSDPDPGVRGHVAWALWCIDNDTWNSVPTLQELLASDDPAIVQFACYVLGTMGKDAAEAIPALEQVIARTTGATRLHAAEATARIDGTNTAAIDVLIAALSDNVVETRWLAAIALSSASDTTTGRVVDALTAALADESADVRTAAALSLGGFGSAAEVARESLESVSENDEPAVQDAARTALACIALTD
ncbi:HEAT repeat domain-containing protein [Maioricimonas sp. JC845]|uniref:HEAT repeat domain-containing protein n=1 Tax=Maioricimonas sp. JC845 TaxID=3232138 RepID=UPI003459FB8E